MAPYGKEPPERKVCLGLLESQGRPYQLANSVVKDIALDLEIRFYDICMMVDRHCKKKWNEWRTTKQKHWVIEINEELNHTTTSSVDVEVWQKRSIYKVAPHVTELKQRSGKSLQSHLESLAKVVHDLKDLYDSLEEDQHEPVACQLGEATNIWSVRIYFHFQERKEGVWEVSEKGSPKKNENA
ncbi:hypothetical protein LguiA_020644 [Lonicera macranthoides]